MIGNGMEMPFPLRREQRPSPTGVGKVTRHYVDIELITDEMADPSRAIRNRAIAQGLPVDMAQLGPWGVFGLSRTERLRFRSLVEKLPVGAPSSFRRTGQLALAVD